MHIGIEIGGTKIQLVTAYPGEPAIQQRYHHSVDAAAGATGILDWIEQTINALPEAATAIGVGFGGPVGAEGQIITSHQVRGWDGFPLGEWLCERTPATAVWVENDANTAALGEARYGAGRGYRHVFYVTLGSGVGGGMVVDGQLYRGASPGEAEIGHIWIVPPTRHVPGQTLEQTASGWAVDRQIRDLLPQLPPDSPLRRYVTQTQKPGGEAHYLAPALADGDLVAAMLVEQIGAVIALGLSHVVHLFHPDVLVLGGGLSLIGEPLRQAVEAALPGLVMSAFQPPPAVKLAQLGTDVVPVGALALAKGER
jgi:glucokinase